MTAYLTVGKFSYVEGCHEPGVVLGLGNQCDGQSQVFVTCEDLPRSPGHVFYDSLQSVLIKGGFDRFVVKLCEPYHASGPGRKSIPPGRYSRMHLVGYFEGIESER